jgi:hypothetical protein
MIGLLDHPSGLTKGDAALSARTINTLSRHAEHPSAVHNEFFLLACRIPHSPFDCIMTGGGVPTAAFAKKGNSRCERSGSSSTSHSTA